MSLPTWRLTAEPARPRPPLAGFLQAAWPVGESNSGGIPSALLFPAVETKLPEEGSG